MALGGGPHQRRLIVRRFAGIDACAMDEQRFHRLGLAGPRARHQHRFAAQRRGVRVGARGEQPLDHRRAPVGAGEMKRCGAFVVRDVRARACAKQQVGDRHVVHMRRPMQGRRPIALRGVRIDALIQERAHRLHVSSSDRLNQT